jgi:DNA-3-methyladenine glycosylase II
MSSFLHTEADLQAGIAALVAQDPKLAPVLEKSGMPALRRREGGYAGLCSIVCGQQLSTASAAAIRARLFAAFDPFHHDTVRLARGDKLARLGLSKPKIKSIKEIGKAIAKGHIDLNAVAAMEADQAHAALTALHGIGPWTADIYLLFCLGNADAWPAGDLALQEAARPEEAARCEGDDEACRKMAAVARGGRASAVGLLSRGEAARGRAGPSDMARGDKKTENERSCEWPVNSTARGSNRRVARPNVSWCSCTATAPTATT